MSAIDPLLTLPSLALRAKVEASASDPSERLMWPFKRKATRTSAANIEVRLIEIDLKGRLCVTPASNDFEMVYREAMEVRWDRDGRFLFSPVPKEMTYTQWFRQIALAVDYQFGMKLRVTGRTQWLSISEPVRAEMSAISLET